MTRPSGDVARVTVLVRVAPRDAWDVFTQETDLWWRKGPAYRVAGSRVGVIAFTPPDAARGVAGVLRETFTADDGDERTHDAGEVRVWQPPEHGAGRLVFTWRGVNFAPGESTEVEVTFVPSEHDEKATRVTVEHRGFASLRPDHPVRHGKDVPAFIAMMGRWWGELATSLREHAAR